MNLMDALSFIENLIDQLSGLSSATAYIVIFGVLFACGLGIPVPEDITLISAGVLASMETISLGGAIAICFCGVLIGDALLFNLGRIYGRKVFKLPVFRRVFTPDRVRGAEERIKRNSKFICFIARFLPGFRAAVFLTAGVMGVRPLTFYILDGIAALISVPVWVIAGWYFGEALEEALGFAKHLQLYLLIFLGSMIALYIMLKWRRKQKELAHTMSLRRPGEADLDKSETLVDNNS